MVTVIDCEDYSDKRESVRHKVHLTGNISQDSSSQNCLFLDLSETGARLQCGSTVDLNNKARCRIDNTKGKVEAITIWQEGPFVGVKFKDRLSSIKAKHNKRSILRLLSSKEGKAIEIMVGLAGLIVGVVTIVYVAIQTNHIRKQNDLQTKELTLQTILQVEDSERFINNILVSSPEFAQLMAPKGDPKEVKETILAHIFLQEWEKMFRLKTKNSLEKDFWDSYEAVIKQVAKTDFIANVINNESALNGYHPEFVKFITGLDV